MHNNTLPIDLQGRHEDDSVDGTTLGAYEATTCSKIGVHSNFNWQSEGSQVPPSDHSIVLMGAILDYI